MAILRKGKKGTTHVFMPFPGGGANEGEARRLESRCKGDDKKREGMEEEEDGTTTKEGEGDSFSFWSSGPPSPPLSLFSMPLTFRFVECSSLLAFALFSSCVCLPST